MEVGVVLALAGEVGEHLDHVGDVDHQQERRVAVFDRQRAGVVGGLLAGLAHHRVPGAGAALGVAGLGRGLFRREQAGLTAGARLALALGGLLGLQDEAVALVAVDPAGRAGAVGQLEEDRALEDVGVARVVLLLRARRFHVQQVAQVDHERLRVAAFRAAGPGPVGDKAVDVAAGGVGRVRVGVGGQKRLPRRAEIGGLNCRQANHTRRGTPRPGQVKAGRGGGPGSRRAGGARPTPPTPA